ncbi:zinc finger, CCHC-type containing protein [Tanacetum coccineum]
MDWSGMLPELLAIIAQKHIVFYEDYYSFAGVCESWRLAAIQAVKVYKFSNGPPSRFPSLMLAQKSKDKEFRELLLLSNKSICKIRLPQIYDKSTSYEKIQNVVPKDFYKGTIAPVAYLIGVDDGERKRLLVLIREGLHVKDTFKTKIFLVFAYDLEKLTWSKVKDLGTKALFVGDASFSIDQDTTGVIKGNSIYFTNDAYFEHGLRGNGKCRDIYHLSDETIEPYFNGVSLNHITLPVWLQSM